MDMEPFFFTSSEIGIIQSDFITQLQSPEAHTVIIEYKTWSDEGGEIDDVYKNNTRPINNTPIQVPTKCIHKVIDQFDTGLLSFRLIKEGDSLFFFYNVNFQIPNGTNEAVPESVIIIDESERRWFPNVKEEAQLKKLLRMMIGDLQYVDILLCSIAREEI